MSTIYSFALSLEVIMKLLIVNFILAFLAVLVTSERCAQCMIEHCEQGCITCKADLFSALCESYAKECYTCLKDCVVS